MRRLQTGERQKFIESICENAAIKLNWAHIAIAQLMSKNIVDRVLTTNFDPLLARAAAMARQFPAVYDLAATKHFQKGLVASRAVFHLHGQHTGFVQVHTREDFAEVEAKLSAAVDSAIGERVWIVVGYSGSNDPLIEIMAKQDFPFGLYWIAFKDQTPTRDVRERLLCKAESRVIYGHDADSFFIELARRTDAFPPRYVAKPFSFLKELTDQLCPFRPEKSELGTDFLASMRRLVDEAISQIEDRPSSASDAKSEPTGKSTALAHRDPSEAEVWAKVIGGHYEQVISSLRAGLDKSNKRIRDAAAWAYNEAGNLLLEKARSSGSHEIDKLLDDACERYAVALQLKPNMDVALNNWANALLEKARRELGDSADALFRAANEKYEASLAARPGDSEKLANWGAMLAQWAKRKQGADANHLFFAATEKFAQSVAIQKSASALLNWADALTYWGKAKDAVEKIKYFELATEKCKEALALDPGSHSALNSCGIALAEWAAVEKPPRCHELFSDSVSKFEAALRLKPDKHESLSNWGLALSLWSERKTGEEAQSLIAKAVERLEAALRLQPNSADALNSLGTSLIRMAKLSKNDVTDTDFSNAIEKFERAYRLNPGKAEALSNHAITLAEWASQKSGLQADELFRAAIAKCDYILQRNARYYPALLCRANAILNWAKQKSGDEAKSLFADSLKAFERAAQNSPHDAHVWANWASALIYSAHLSADAEKQGLLDAAIGKCLNAEAIEPGVAAYNLACSYAIKGDKRRAQEWLITSQAHGKLPPRSHLVADLDLISVRDEPWFQELLRPLP